MNARISSRVGVVAVTALVLAFVPSAIAAGKEKPIAHRSVSAVGTSTAIADGRSPDTVDAALAAQTQVADGRSPDTRDAGIAAHVVPATSLDLRSPDTRDAALLAHSSGPTVVVDYGSGRFDWTDAGIGAAGGFGIALILGGLLVSRLNSRRKLAV